MCVKDLAKCQTDMALLCNKASRRSRDGLYRFGGRVLPPSQEEFYPKKLTPTYFDSKGSTIHPPPFSSSPRGLKGLIIMTRGSKF